MSNDKTLENLKKLRDSINGVITVYEKENPTEEEIERAMGKFIMTLMEFDALK
jgi:hypothetical protein